MKTEDGDQVNILIQPGSFGMCYLGCEVFKDSMINSVIDHFLVFLVV